MFGRRNGNPSEIRPAVEPDGLIERYCAYYPMTHKNRGKAIIFAHSVFEVPDEEIAPREGNEVDCQMLTESLGRLGFDVNLYKDKRLEDIRKILKKGLYKNIHKINHIPTGDLFFQFLQRTIPKVIACWLLFCRMETKMTRSTHAIVLMIFPFCGRSLPAINAKRLQVNLRSS